MSHPAKISEAFVAVCNRGMDLGHKDISKRPGLTEFEHNGWVVQINPHGREVESVPAFSVRCLGPNFADIVVLGPEGGAAVGDAEDRLIEAMVKA